MKALIIVDVQNDFCKNGSLAVPDADSIISLINHKINNITQCPYNNRLSL